MTKDIYLIFNKKKIAKKILNCSKNFEVTKQFLLEIHLEMVNSRHLCNVRVGRDCLGRI